MNPQFHVVQDSLYISVQWRYDTSYPTWGVSKMLNLDDFPATVDPALIVNNTSPMMPTTEEHGRENARRWTLAVELCRQMDNVYTVQDDFKSVALTIETDAITASHFTTEGRKDSTRRVTIHVAV